MMENSPLLLAVSFTQQLDPLAGLVSASAFWSTVVAALPVIVLFWLLVEGTGLYFYHILTYHI